MAPTVETFSNSIKYKMTIFWTLFTLIEFSLLIIIGKYTYEIQRLICPLLTTSIWHRQTGMLFTLKRVTHWRGGHLVYSQLQFFFFFQLFSLHSTWLTAISLTSFIRRNFGNNSITSNYRCQSIGMTSLHKPAQARKPIQNCGYAKAKGQPIFIAFWMCDVNWISLR